MTFDPDRCTCKPLPPIWPDHPTDARQWNARCPECGIGSARHDGRPEDPTLDLFGTP